MLNRYGSEVASVFDLLGRSEVNLTAALGWTLSCSPHLLASILERLGVVAPEVPLVAVETLDELGRTDIEITGNSVKVIFEAKQGWLVPGEDQLSRYRGRFGGFEDGLLVSLSDSSERWAVNQLPSEVDGIQVKHLPWDVVRDTVKATMARSRGRERIWLEQLGTYMGRATSKIAYDDQWVFCVVASDTLFGGRSFKDYVVNERAYFHPYGGNNTWPKAAPNFLCFRWAGRVQQVNRVTSFEIVPHLSDRWPSVTNGESAGPHIIYDLGPDIPIPMISTTGTYANGRVWCLLDQLLIHATLAEAVHASAELRNRA
ncbi:hypothetical protein ACWEQA_18740 [Nocardia sp. NPDC004085]